MKKLHPTQKVTAKKRKPKKVNKKPFVIPSPKAKKCAKGKHRWTYRGGEAPCIYCGWFINPDGSITKKP